MVELLYQNLWVSRCFTHGVSLTVFHGCHLSQMELECVFVFCRSRLTALDWNSQHCPVSSHCWPTIQWCNAKVRHCGHGSRPKIARWIPSIEHGTRKVPHFVETSNLVVISTGRLDYPKESIPSRFRTGSPNVDPQPCWTETRRGRQSNHGVLCFPGYSFGIWDGAGYGLVGVARIGYGSIAINTMLKGIQYL